MPSCWYASRIKTTRRELPPLCYAQIGGLIFATFATLLLVPVIYSIFVLDLKIVRWGDEAKTPRSR